MTPRPRKKARVQLTKERILEKAIELLDAEGVQGLSMRRLGEALGVEAMAVYHYFPNKDAMLDAVVELLIQETGPAELTPGTDWKSLMASGPAAAGRALEAHPKAGWLFLGRQYTTAPSLQMLEVPLAILQSAGFRGQALVDAAHAIFAYSAGWYILTSGEGGSWGGPSEEAIAAAEGTTPLAASLAPELRDWSRGFDEGFMALLEGLDARRGEK
jgi:TetR/AcrR family transcriptional regulator, tetracycline repressor protein